MSKIYIYGVAKYENGLLSFNQKQLVKTESGELEQSLNICYKELGIMYPKFFKMDSISKTGFLCAEILVQQFPEVKEGDLNQVGVLINSCSGSLDSDSKFQNTISEKDNYFPSPGVFVYTLPNIVIGEICIRHGFKGENLCLISSVPEARLMQVNLKSWFQQDSTNYCIGGWIDAKENVSLATLFLVGRDSDKSIAEWTEENIRKFCSTIHNQ